MKAIGGNRGYIGYSESVRSARAKAEGKFPKTLFKKHYGITEKKFKELEERGVIYISEWHHTSKYGNRTNFYAIDNYILFLLLTNRKEEAFKRYSRSRIYHKPVVKNKTSYSNKSKFLSEATEKLIGLVNIGDTINYRGQMLECYHMTKRRKAPCFIIVKQKH